MHSLTSALDEGEWSASRLGRFTSTEKVPGTHWIGGWVGARTGLDAAVKKKIPSPRRESNPRTLIIQPVAQRYITELSRLLIEQKVVENKLYKFRNQTKAVNWYCSLYADGSRVSKDPYSTSLTLITEDPTPVRVTDALP
jgi:hypothetical protein